MKKQKNIVLTLNGFRELITSFDSGRAFNAVDEYNVVLFGFYKINYNPNTEVFSLFQKKHTSFNSFEWVKIKSPSHYVLRSSTFYYGNGGADSDFINFFSKIAEEAAKNIVNDLLSHGLKLKDHFQCKLLSVNEEFEEFMRDAETLKSRNNVATIQYGISQLWYSFPELIVSKNSILLALESDDAGMLKTVNGNYYLHTPESLRLICSDIFTGGMYSGGWRHAVKGYGKWLRTVSSKGYRHIMGKVYWSRSFTDLSIYNYNLMVKRKISTINSGNLSLFLQLPTFNMREMKSFDYSNKSFHRLITKIPNLAWVTKADVKRIRKIPVSVQKSFFPKEGCDFKLKNNIFTPAHIVKMTLCLFIYKLNDIDKFPTPVIKQLIDRLEMFYEDPSYERILLQWLQFHSRVYKQHGYIAHKVQWGVYINEICHAFDYIYYHEGAVTIQKNQNWHSIWQQVCRWNHLRINSVSMRGLKWEASLLSNGEIDGVSFKELLNSKELITEGYEMNHCVGCYDNRCYEKGYRIFSLRHGDLRATLGLRVDATNSSVSMDQLHGYGNSSPEALFLPVTKKLVSALNKKILNAA
ncbi:PcfJ domain-containing protein [Citrobacter freundii]|uniref:PcfJ domain-containing protein n=1 Tax=Citrobacter freundii TaxID=546 RepID=UPI0019049FF6|nr:PcfJ domain-containing protein [Citrobacter freundii]MBJ8931572.1 PcfJ domain-containing protein [Citrobacter freundii]